MTHIPELVLLDASCLLNLYATGRLRDIAAAQPYSFGAADYVVRQEALYTLRPAPGERTSERVPVNMDPLVDEGVVQVLHLEGQEEAATFVDLAALVDDGEAITAALAFHRGFALAIDDRKVRRLFAEYTPTVPLVSTLQLLRQWEQAPSVEPSELREASLAMRHGSSSVASEQDSLYEWWSAITRDEADS